MGTAGFILSIFINAPFKLGWLMILSGLLHLIRLYNWHRKLMWKMTLLWSLHLAYLAMPIGLMLLFISNLTNVVPFVDTLHIIVITAMAGMILSMMSRVSLGHTARSLHLNSTMAINFVLVFFAGLVRRMITPQRSDPLLFIMLNGDLWLTSFSFFIRFYFPILTKPRLDRQIG